MMMEDDEGAYVPSDPSDDGDNVERVASTTLSPTPPTFVVTSAENGESSLIRGDGPISVSNMPSGELPRRKRARYGLQFEDADQDKPDEADRLQSSDAQSSPRIVRDDKYYLLDGSCILLVDNTLFNVHRTVLSKDNSSFSTMFDLPQGSAHAEGSSDDTPIVLLGDTAEEFRHFLWALYALYVDDPSWLNSTEGDVVLSPPELMVVHTSQAPLPTLVDIARVANKYGFKSLETWALDAVHDYANRKPSPLFVSIPANFTFEPSRRPTTPHDAEIAQVTSLVRLAVMCGHSRLLSIMITLLRQLMTVSIQYAYLVMTLADELDIGALRGVAYLEVMQKAVVVRRTLVDGAPPEGTVDSEGRLIITRDQQLRLLSGYYRLTGAWERIRSEPPTFAHSTSCSATWHQHGCTQSWLEFWKEKTRCDSVLSMGLADALGRLRAVAKEFDKWGSATYMHLDCRMIARRGIQEKIRGIEEALPDYFSEGSD